MDKRSRRENSPSNYTIEKRTVSTKDGTAAKFIFISRRTERFDKHTKALRFCIDQNILNLRINMDFAAAPSFYQKLARQACK